MDNSALLTTAVITGILAVLTMIFKSVKKSECWKTDKGVCCDFDTRVVRSSSSLDAAFPAALYQQITAVHSGKATVVQAPAVPAIAIATTEV